MARQSKIPPDSANAAGKRGGSGGKQSCRANRLRDAVYREMYRLEMRRPGAEMGLALALLRACVQAERLSEPADTREWLKTVCPIGLRMIEAALGEYPKSGPWPS